MSRRVLRVFAGVIFLLLFQLAWWMIYHVRSTAQMRDLQLEHWRAERRWAVQLILHATNQAPAELLAKHFNHLVWADGFSDDAALRARYPGHDVAVDPGRVENLQQRHAALIRMFWAEGGFFCLLTALGAWLILRTLQYEAALMNRQANFLSAVTHELKSPLASLRLYTDTLSLRELPKAKRDEYLGNMSADIERLGNLVGNLLAVAKLDEGSSVGLDEILDLNVVVPTCAEPLQKAFAERGIRLQIQVASKPLLVRCDQTALCTVVRNLLDNARKYGAGQPVLLDLGRDATHAILQVHDGGIGLAPADVDNVFQKFYRVGDEMVRQTEGSGLGLYLVRALLSQCQGEVSARSAGVGKGTTFTVRLPLCDKEPAG